MSCALAASGRQEGAAAVARRKLPREIGGSRQDRLRWSTTINRPMIIYTSSVLFPRDTRFFFSVLVLPTRHLSLYGELLYLFYVQQYSFRGACYIPVPCLRSAVPHPPAGSQQYRHVYAFLVEVLLPLASFVLVRFNINLLYCLIVRTWNVLRSFQVGPGRANSFIWPCCFVQYRPPVQAHTE